MTKTRLDLRWIAAPLALTALLLIVNAALAFQGDGRINLAGYMGGDSVYCVDANHNPTGDPANAGIRLLNITGNELFYVSPAQIAAVPHFPATNTLIAQGNGSYGPVYLERLTGGEFQLIGTEDHGKTFFFTWTDCTQVTPIPSSHANGGGSSLFSTLTGFCHKAYDGFPADLADCLSRVPYAVSQCEPAHIGAKECYGLYVV